MGDADVDQQAGLRDRADRHPVHDDPGPQDSLHHRSHADILPQVGSGAASGTMPLVPTTSPAALLITVAPTGAETTKADCPQLPTTLDELVETARACEAAGAAMIHVHIRDDDHRPTLDLGRLTETVAALHDGTDLVVQLSTGGSVHDPLDARLQVLDAAARLLQPDDGHHQLRRRRVLQPVALRVRALPAQPGAPRSSPSSSSSTSARSPR